MGYVYIYIEYLGGGYYPIVSNSSDNRIYDVYIYMFIFIYSFIYLFIYLFMYLLLLYIIFIYRIPDSST